MEINELLNKIRLQKGLHSYFEMKTKPTAILVRLFLIVLPAIITFIAIADKKIIAIIFPEVDTNSIQLLISVISIVLFLITVIVEIFGVDEKYREHRIAINQLIKLRKNIDNEIDEYPERKNDITRKYNDIYFEMVNTFPEFTDNQYIKGKKYYIERLKIKRNLEKEFKEIVN